MAEWPMPLGADDALRRLAPLCRSISQAVGRPNGVWLVGGVVRDAFLDRPLLDVDLVVDDDAAGVARRYASATGGAAFPLSDRWGCWRVTPRTGAGGDITQLDVCTWREGSLEADLRLRDFTINAMAVSCDAETPTLIDPVGGQRDLQHGVLRVVAPSALADDPLRMLRAARIAHVLGCGIDSGTRQLVQQLAHRAPEPSGERVFAELCQLVEAPESRRGMRLLDELGLLEHLLPELHRCKGVDQSRFHHLDVYEHTLAVLDNSEDVVEHADHYLGSVEGMPESPFSSEARRITLFAALCHDLGKPETQVVDLTSGRVRFPDHHHAGVPIVDALCNRWATSRRFRDALRLLVRTHLHLGFLLHGELDTRERYRFLRATEPWAAEAIVLSLSDRLATAGVDDRRRWVRAHVLAARQLWADHWHEVAHGRPAPLLDGREVAELASLQPGPAIGELVRALAEEQAVGAVSTREQAIAFVRSAAAGAGDAAVARGRSS